MEPRLSLREHIPKDLSRDQGAMVVDAVQGLASRLRPRISQVSRNDGVVEVKNFIGSVRMADGSVLEVEPKVPVGSTWPYAVVQLLSESSRISVTGSQRSRQGDARQDLTGVIAFEYVRRLERALSKDGPLQIFSTSEPTRGTHGATRFSSLSSATSSLLPTTSREASPWSRMRSAVLFWTGLWLQNCSGLRAQ
jgi:hypothetical protein